MNFPFWSWTFQYVFVSFYMTYCLIYVYANNSIIPCHFPISSYADHWSIPHSYYYEVHFSGRFNKEIALGVFSPTSQHNNRRVASAHDEVQRIHISSTVHAMSQVLPDVTRHVTRHQLTLHLKIKQAEMFPSFTEIQISNYNLIIIIISSNLICLILIIIIFISCT